jgi:MFS family permease
LIVLSRYLIGATAARSGDESSGPALLLLGLSSSTAVTGSTLLAGLTIAAAVGGPVLGAVLDRARSPGRVLAAALAGYAAGLALITVLFGRVPFALVLVTAALAGLLNPAVAGGWTAQLPALVAPERLPRASTLDAMTFTAASLAGPGLAGLLANLAGAPFALTVASVLVAAAVPVAWRLPRRAERPRNPGKPAAAALVLLRNRPLRRTTVTTTLSYAGIGMAMVCYPVLGLHRLGGAGYGTLLLTVMAVASLLVNAVLARHPLPGPPDRTVLLSTVVLGAGFLATAAAPDAILLVAAAVLIGFGEGPQLSAVFAVRHREAPADVRAQVFTTAASVKIAGMAAGTAVAGPLAGQSPAVCLCVAAGLQLAAAIGYLVCSPGTGTRDGTGARRPSPARGA